MRVDTLQMREAWAQDTPVMRESVPRLCVEICTVPQNSTGRSLMKNGDNWNSPKPYTSAIPML
jgi:hypothetical protein